MAEQKPTSRREFLQGRSAVRALIEKTQNTADAVAETLDGTLRVFADGPIRESCGSDVRGRSSPLDSMQQTARICVSRRAMACEFSVEFAASDGALGNEAAISALDLIEQLEAQLTIYRDQSEVLDMNAEAALRAVAVEPRLFDLLLSAQAIAAETGGAFDMTSGPLSRVWGFFRRAGRLPSDAEVHDALARVGYQRVQLDSAQKTIRFTEPGVEIQLNSIGKGYALDRGAECLAYGGLSDFLFQGGQSSVLARGVQPGAGVAGWRIGVPHPRNPARRIGEIVLSNAALGTSGAATQFFEFAGRRYGHVIDPRTGRPVENMLLATAVAQSAATADALATAFFVMGPGATAEYCRRHPACGAVLICDRSGDGELDVHLFNLSPEQWLPEIGLF